MISGNKENKVELFLKDNQDLFEDAELEELDPRDANWLLVEVQRRDIEEKIKNLSDLKELISEYKTKHGIN